MHLFSSCNYIIIGAHQTLKNLHWPQHWKCLAFHRRYIIIIGTHCQWNILLWMKIMMMNCYVFLIPMFIHHNWICHPYIHQCTYYLNIMLVSQRYSTMPCVIWTRLQIVSLPALIILYTPLVTYSLHTPFCTFMWQKFTSIFLHLIQFIYRMKNTLINIITYLFTLHYIPHWCSYHIVNSIFLSSVISSNFIYNIKCIWGKLPLKSWYSSLKNIALVGKYGEDGLPLI